MKNIATFIGFIALILSCSSPKTSQPKIVGGASASEHYQFFVGLHEVGSSKKYFCADVVATAAHCVHKMTNKLQVILNPGSKNSAFNEDVRNVSAVQIHPEWDVTTDSNDIALLFLESKANDRTFLKPIDLNSTIHAPKNVATLRVIGYGNLTSVGTLNASNLHEVDLPVIPNEICKSAYSNLKDTM
ncbi:MAG TPA: trypsin-like serine protease, partial [Oligoflexus sp.]|uniref:S1 family peptidase n=1 Tax=Oligoflexus sp. TaxID=1971216 RepID=UPI002D712F66